MGLCELSWRGPSLVGFLGLYPPPSARGTRKFGDKGPRGLRPCEVTPLRILRSARRPPVSDPKGNCEPLRNTGSTFELFVPLFLGVPPLGTAAKMYFGARGATFTREPERLPATTPPQVHLIFVSCVKSELSRLLGWKAS